MIAFNVGVGLVLSVNHALGITVLLLLFNQEKKDDITKRYNIR